MTDAEIDARKKRNSRRRSFRVVCELFLLYFVARDYGLFPATLFVAVFTWLEGITIVVEKLFIEHAVIIDGFSQILGLKKPATMKVEGAKSDEEIEVKISRDAKSGEILNVETEVRKKP